MVVEFKGVEDYLDGSIVNPIPGKNPVETKALVSPSISPAIPIQAETPWDSSTSYCRVKLRTQTVIQCLISTYCKSSNPELGLSSTLYLS